MDEIVLYDGVKNILLSENLQTFFFSVVDGGTQVYGRVFWNINAMAGFLPNHFLGQPGLIFSGRTTSVLFLSFSYFFLSIAFLKNWFFRLVSFFILLNIPFSSYYMTMPKPEPIQMFFLSLFLFFLKKNEFLLNKKYWVFLGLAAGAKVSSLPVIAPILIFSIWKSFLSLGYYKTMENTPKMAGYFLVGISLAVPILLKPLALSFLIYSIGPKFFERKGTEKPLQNMFLLFAVLFVNLFYSVVCKKYFGVHTGLYRWFTQTVLHPGHGSDMTDAGFFTWMRFFFCEFVSPFLFLNVFLLMCSLVMVYSITIAKKHKDINQNHKNFDFKQTIFLTSGLVLFFIVFIMTNRIWGHYLFVGFTLIVVSLVSMSEMVFLKKNIIFWVRKSEERRTKISAFLFMVFLLSLALLFWFPQNLIQYEKLANRTKTEEYRKNHNSFLQIKETLTVLSSTLNRKINVKNIGSPFVPDNNKNFFIVGLERPFTQWSSKHEVLLVKNIREVSIDDINPNFLNYDLRVKERKGYDRFVVPTKDPCLTEVCYKKIKTFENGTELLILASIEEKLEDYKKQK